jgi:glycosyltransferase involved in cell wall biosynthesis
MRAKILEGMALGRVVLSTTLGLEGIPATHGAEALIADMPAAFAQAVADCYAHPELLRRMSQKARAFFEKNYDNQTVAQDLLHAYQQLIHTN